MATQGKAIIGTSSYVKIEGVKGAVHAKVDTGADSSSVWASVVYVDEKKQLHYVLFGPHSPHYDGIERVSKEYKLSRVTSSSGHAERRYKTPLIVTIEGRTVRAWFTLTSARADRTHPMLIGRRTLFGKFLVDVSQRAER